MSHEKAGRFTRLVSKANRTRIKIMPRKMIMACVSRTRYRTPKKIIVTSRISIIPSQLRRSKMKRALFRNAITAIIEAIRQPGIW
jgi:hypothetical protein